MTAIEALAVARLKSWSRDREKAHAGKLAVWRNVGYIPRTLRSCDSRIVRIIDFEIAFGHLPDWAQILLLLKYRDGHQLGELSRVTHTSVRALATRLTSARCQLANILDRRNLL